MMGLGWNKLEDRDALLHKALGLIAKGKLDKAARIYDRLLAQEPENLRVQHKKADLLVRMQQRPAAIALYIQVAKGYTRKGFFLKAIALYKQVLRLDDALPEVYQGLADAYEQLGLNQEAVPHLRWLANHHAGRSEVEPLLEVLRRIVNLGQDNPQERVKLAELFFLNGKIPEAVSELHQAADALRHTDRTAEYVEVLEKLIRYDRGRQSALRELADHFLQHGETRRAVETLRHGFRNNPRDLNTLKLIARVFAELNLVPNLIEVYKRMAALYRESGCASEMQQLYTLILDLSPEDREAQEGLLSAEGLPSPPVDGVCETNPEDSQEVAIQVGTFPPSAGSRPEEVLFSVQIHKAPTYH